MVSKSKSKPAMHRRAKEGRHRAIKQMEKQLKDGTKPYKPGQQYPEGTEFVKASGEERIIGVRLSAKDKTRINKEIETCKTRV